jgi:peptidoglycan-N-acetylmuramic acid deacetylase
MRRETETAWCAEPAGPARRAVLASLGATLASGAGWGASRSHADAVCDKPLYLTFDTGHMGVAPHVADVLARHDVKVTFFLAAERTVAGGHCLDDTWAPWWRERAQEGHAFGSHTWNHDIWRADVDGGFRFVPTQGPRVHQAHVLSAAGYCQELQRPAQRLQQMTGQAMGAIFRAAGGKTSKALLAATQACGWSHVGWSDTGFLGDELPSHSHPNAMLLERSLRTARAGDIQLAHLGIWSRQDPWAPAVLEPLIKGLKARGFCFRTLRDHPVLGAAAQRQAPQGSPVASRS